MSEELSRRGFLGAAAGAAVTPMLATQTGGGVPMPPPNAPPAYYGENANTAFDEALDPDYVRRLQRHARGQFTEEEEEQFRNNSPWVHNADNVEALRSISAGQKARMRADYYAQRERERWFENAKKELAQMAKRGLGL